MGPTNNIGYLLQHLASVLAKQSDQVLLEQLGIGFSQYKILMSLQWNPRTQQRYIADSLGQTEASISRQIKLMINKGLLQTTISKENRREHITSPTAKGIKLTEAARQVLNTYHGPMFEHLSEKQREQLVTILRVMHEHACSPGKLATCQPLLSNINQ